MHSKSVRLSLAAALGALVAGAVALAANPPMMTVHTGAKVRVMTPSSGATLTGNTLTVTVDGKDTSLAVNAKTQVIGKGLGTKSRAKGGKATITDLLNPGDRVSVTYQEDGSTMRATKVQLVAAAK